VARSAEVEAALWSAIRALNDRATTFETLAKDAARISNDQSAALYEIAGARRGSRPRSRAGSCSM
jgi:hypothetical protein